jgi:hypothetical protein
MCDALRVPGPTASHRLAEILLGENLEEFVRSRRRTGVPWRRIARDLWVATDHEADIAFETLRLWFPDEPDDDEKAATA